MPHANRIAIVCPRFAEHGTVGGAETLLKALAERLAMAGRQVDFLTTCATNHFTWENTVPAGTRSFGSLSVTFFPVDQDRDVATFLRIQEMINSGKELPREDEQAWISNSVNSRALIAHLEAHKERYDRILAGPYLFGVTYFASRVAPAKTLLVPCLHDEVFAYLGIMRDMFRSVAGFVFNTDPEKKLAVRLYDLDDRGTVVGIGLADFQADRHAFAHRHKLQQPYVMYSGRRETLKGTPLLTDYMHAFRQRTGRDIRIVFTGSGDIEAPEELRPFIHDVGFVSEQEKHEAMAGATCFIHPSVNESLGIVLLESWLAGTPALVHSKSEVLKDQCRRSGGGLWFRSYPEFEECLLRYLEDPALRARMADSGRSYVRSYYSWPAVEKRLLHVLDL